MQERLYLYLEKIAQACDLEELKSFFVGQKDPLFLEIIERILSQIPQRCYRSLRDGCEALAESASELQISTIHSLAVSILRRHPVEAEIPLGTRFAREDEEDIEELASALLERWWQKEAFGNADNEKDLSTLLQVIPVSEIQHWLELTVQAPWLPEELAQRTRTLGFEEILGCLERLSVSLQDCTTKKITLIRNELRGLLARVRKGEDYAITQLASFLLLHKNYLFLNGRNIPKTITRIIRSLPRTNCELLATYLSSYSACLGAALHFEHSDAWSTWLKFLSRFSAWIQSAGTVELGVITFDEMISKAVILLKEHEEVRRFEFDRLRALLVDEFQDTDPGQLELISHLLRRPDRSKRDILGFFVGDTKQSIYRFRGVEVHSVLRFFRNYEDLLSTLRRKQEFHLQTNFRSSESVTEFSNCFFTQQFDLVDVSDLLLNFRKGNSLPVQWLQLTAPSEKNSISAEDSRQIAAEATSLIIQDCIREQPTVRYRDILILTRSNRELDTLLPVLQEAGIPVASSGARTFLQNQEVLDLINLLIALLHPFDSVALATVLRSPLVNLADDEIHRLLERVSPERLIHSDDSIPGFVGEKQRAQIIEMRRLAQDRRTLSMQEWLQQLRLFIPESLYTRTADREGRAIVRLDRVLKGYRATAEYGNHPPIVWLLRQRSKARSVRRWDEDFGEDVNLSDEGVDAVRVMTIHRAKGLESRIVIVPSWTTLMEESLGKGVAPSRQIMQLVTPDGTDLRALSVKWGPLKIVTDNYLDSLELEHQSHREEAVRLAYVAVTRACDQLILIQTPSRHLDKHCFQNVRGPEVQISTHLPKPTLRSKPPPIELKLDIKSHRHLWDQYRKDLPLPQPTLRHPSDPVTSGEPVFPREESTTSSLVVGNLVHRYLELRLQDGFDQPSLQSLWHEIDPQSPGSATLKQAESILSAFFTGKATDTSGQPLISRIERCQILGQELPVYLTIEKQEWSGVIDLVMRDKKTIYAIDFKTGASSQGLQDLYAQQEKVYTEAVRRLFPSEPVIFEFWWLGTGD
jgi:ATP-dependent exoDNAse (exonuclease V) beta subunit